MVLLVITFSVATAILLVTPYLTLMLVCIMQLVIIASYDSTVDEYD